MTGDALCLLHCEIDLDCLGTLLVVYGAYRTSVRQFVTSHYLRMPQHPHALQIVVAAYLPVSDIVIRACVLVPGCGLYTDK
jgi:hypothetical protein